MATSFIQSSKAAESMEGGENILDEDDDGIELNDEQFKALQIVAQHVSEMRRFFTSPKGSRPMPEPMRMIILGGAGTGKSVTIQKIANHVNSRLGNGSVLLMAPTGVAAFNINGCTIHSALSIRVGSIVDAELNPKNLRQLQEDLKDVKYFIIDEFSMVGKKLMNIIAKRGRNIFTSENPFGNVSVILVGDLRQLPPVLDAALYSTGECSVDNYGVLAYRQFNRVVKLSISHRQAGNDEEQILFRNILERLSQGNSTVEDWQHLMTRTKINVSEEEWRLFDEALRLFTTNAEVDEYNKLKLVSTNNPIARIPAQHNCRTARGATSDHAQGLESTLYLTVGSKVMLRRNLWTNKGLVNGACGEVFDIVYLPGKTSPNDFPLTILVNFKKYRGPAFISSNPTVVPLYPIMATWKDSTTLCTRLQFPLTLSWSMTVHKCQGLTLDKVVVDLGKKETSCGISFVAVSRIRNIKDILFHPPFDFERLRKISQSKNLKDRIAEERRLNTIALISGLFGIRDEL